MAGTAHRFDGPYDLCACLRAVRNPPRPVRVSNDAARRGDAGGLLQENAIGSQLRGVAGVRTRAEGIAGFEFYGHQSLGCLNQVVGFAGEPVATRYERAVQLAAPIGILGDHTSLRNAAPRDSSTGVDPDE